MDIRLTDISELDELIVCHQKAFPGSLSTWLGKKFCSKMLEWYILNERGIMFHVRSEGKMVGYCGGIKTKEPGIPGAATTITQYAFSQFVRSFVGRPWLIFHPENLKRIRFIIRNLALKIGLIKQVNKLSKVDVAEFQPRWGLVVIGTIPEVRGKGFGFELIRKFEELASADDVHEVRLSVKKNNKRAIDVYQKSGWLIMQEHEDSLELRKLI